ncbi:MAG: S9 family peptidase [Nocardioides sp.]
MEAPKAARKPIEQTHHGRSRVDEYDWLRAKDDPDVVAYLEAENAYTDARTAHLAPLREVLFEEIRSRTLETDLSVPVRSRGHWYYGRSFAGREYGASCRVPVTGADDWNPPRPDQDCDPDQPALAGEQVLLDFNELADGHDFFSVGGSAVSPVGDLLAYAVDVVGDERYTIRVKDLGGDRLLPDEISDVRGSVVWAPDGASFYYLTVDDAWRPDTIRRHVLGESQDADEVIFHEPDPRFWVGCGRSRDDRFIVIAAASKTTSEFHLYDAERPSAGLWRFAERVEGLDYSVEPAVIGGTARLLVLHNRSGVNFELSMAPAAPTSPEDWVPVIPHDPQVRLESVDAFSSHLVVDQRSGGLTQIRILPLDHAGVADDFLIDFGAEIYAVGSGSNPEFEQPTVRLGYTSLATPASIYDYHVRTGERVLRYRKPVLGDFDPEQYHEQRLWATAADGERIPLSLIARKQDVGVGPVPLLLYGYGSYEASIEPEFSVPRLSLLDRGAAFAIAHVRGGGEMGRRWYDDGKLDRKHHTFDDFVACARHLISEGWTTADRLVAEGGSAGGLLMGAIANQAPEEFAGIVAAVPFVDPLTTMLDATLPLTVTEYDEWGDPATDPAAYDTIRAYAPYDNVAAVDYPAILAETSLNDTRVLYVEPAKWIARLRAVATGRQDFLLKTEMAAGHGGVTGRYRSWHERAFTLAWILDRMGLG